MRIDVRAPFFFEDLQRRERDSKPLRFQQKHRGFARFGGEFRRNRYESRRVEGVGAETLGPRSSATRRDQGRGRRGPIRSRVEALGRPSRDAPDRRGRADRALATVNQGDSLAYENVKDPTGMIARISGPRNIVACASPGACWPRAPRDHAGLGERLSSVRCVSLECITFRVLTGSVRERSKGSC